MCTSSVPWHKNPACEPGTITAYAGGYDYYLEKSGILDDEKRRHHGGIRLFFSFPFFLAVDFILP